MSDSLEIALPLSRSSVLVAYDTIEPIVHRTPVFTSSSISKVLPGGNALLFKAENLQKGGAFKFRGATFSLSRLTDDQLSKGVCTHSSGQMVLFEYKGDKSSLYDPLIGLQGTMLVLWRLQRSRGASSVM